MAGGASSEPEGSALQVTEMKEEFQFLLCDRCHAEVPCPKLLPCLHNLCSQCLEENKPIELCVICGTPYLHFAETPQNLENVFFTNLQVKVSLYQKVTGSKNPGCNGCEKEAEFWCSTCVEFLCLVCFRNHQRYLKKESHETRPLNDFQTESCRDFLSTIRKTNTMYCSKEGHSTQMLSLYCRQCSQSMCAICALLDSKHMGQHCDISQEIQCRQNELQNMSAELKEKKNAYNKSYGSLEELVRNMERSRYEMQGLIQQNIEEMIQMLRERGEGFLAEVEAHHHHQVQEVKKKLQEMDGAVQRITASQRLVEKLDLYASGQEVLEMHPFLKKSMMELRRNQPSTAEGIEVSNFLETKSQLQNLLERVTKDKETDPAKPQTEPQEDFSGRSSLKREYVEEETNTEGHPKMVKIEPLNDEEWDKPGTSYGSTGGSYTSGSQGGLRETLDDTLQVAHGYSNSSDLEDDSSMSISSEEESTDVDDETRRSILPLDINHTSPVGQKSHMRHPLSKPADVSLESRIIFFDLKSQPGNIVHLVALGEGPAIFHVTISCLENISNCVFGMDEFLQYLSSLQMPILVGYKLWSMGIPALLDALQKMNKEEEFEASISGFLDALPLIRDKFPDISNYTLKNLDKIYLWGKLDNTDAADCAKILKDLCTIFEINNMFQRRPLIACSSFRCYSSLQPLLWEKVLSMPSVQTLALHNVSLFTLQSVYQSDPEKGLKKLCRSLNTRRRIGEKKIQRLSKIRTYFQNLPSSSQCSSLPRTHQTGC